MKFCLAANEKLSGGESSLLNVEGGVIAVNSEVVRNTYKTLDNFVLVTEVTRMDNGAIGHKVTAFEDIPNYVNEELVQSYVAKYSNKELKDIENPEMEFVDMFKPDVTFNTIDFDLSVEDFLSLEKSLADLDNKISYKVLQLPGSIKEELSEIYLRHKQAQKVNMNYNIDLSCALAKARLRAMTDESVNELKKALKSVATVQEKPIQSSSRSMTLRFVIKKD